ncbi:DnaJ-domain-containing protein [Jackrogersella minutella]|nr:DnaJ-domain-containing protein [Jackrogersella minutella]
MDKSADLLTYAKNYATTEDLYDLLGVTSDTLKEDIHRAWRKRSLKYHPDKAGANFDAEKWELFERARDVLSDPPAREAYDSLRSAALLREQQRHAMDAKKRAMIEDLEARERGAVKHPRGDDDGSMMSGPERTRLAEAGKRRVEERQRLMREAEEREKQREQDQAHKEPQEESNTPKPDEQVKHKTPDVSSSAESNKMDIDTKSPAINDGYDDQVADIERRLEAARQRKAARKDKKAARKNGTPSGDKLNARQATATPTPDITEEPKAEEKKGPSTSSSGAGHSFSVNLPPPRFDHKTGPIRPDPDFRALIARLHAMQAEVEARKKKAKQEAAAASEGMVA